MQLGAPIKSGRKFSEDLGDIVDDESETSLKDLEYAHQED